MSIFVAAWIRVKAIGQPLGSFKRVHQSHRAMLKGHWIGPGQFLKAI
jgi:hypothetical protein